MSGAVSEADRLVRMTDRALAEVRAIAARERPLPGTGLRLGVVGGGCSGLQYKMEFSERQPKDHVESFGDVEVLLDPKSSIYLKGITLDFDDGLMGKGFVFRNPNATNTCGCGESFTV
jgi:iron-sulfur cluster assembly protein